MLSITRNLGTKVYLGRRHEIAVEVTDTGQNWADFEIGISGQRVSDVARVRLTLGRRDCYELAPGIKLYLLYVSVRGVRLGIDAPKDIPIHRDNMKKRKAA